MIPTCSIRLTGNLAFKSTTSAGTPFLAIGAGSPPAAPWEYAFEQRRAPDGRAGDELKPVIEFEARRR